METNLQPEQPLEAPKSTVGARGAIKIFGVGNAGLNIMEQLIRSGLSGPSFVAVNTDAPSLAASSAAERVHLETRVLRGLGTGGDPERGRELAEANLSSLQSLCAGTSIVFIVAGLGGGSGTGLSPVLARVAKESGALVVGFVALPFECECSRCERAQQGLEELKQAADGVICLPNEKVLKLADENTSVIDAFRIANELLADGIRGVWRLLAHPGLIPLHFDEVCGLIRDRHAESAFAVAESAGPTRSREVLDKLMAHPLLEGGQRLSEADSVMVSLMGGPDLTMAEINRVMAGIKEACGGSTVLMGAGIDESFRERLAVTLVAARKDPEGEPAGRDAAAGGEDLKKQLLSPAATARPGSRFVPPAPSLPRDKLEQLMTRQARGRKSAARMRQGQLPLEIISKGRFDKSEPTIHKGEDLDVPTYIRRGVLLN